MVDIHCHILPGMDDGSPSLEISLEMAEMAIADGITHIVATPHANARFAFVPETIRQRRDELQARLGGRLTLVTGCDFHLSYENLQDIRTQPEKYAINQKSYLLVEFADFAIPPRIDETLHELQLAGLHPIITHPERNALLSNNRQQLDRWIHMGCTVQVTALSLLGHFGSHAQRAAESWLDSNRIHFIASDAHNTSSRPPRLREAFEKVAQGWGTDVAKALFQENPLAALEGRPLPWVPELREAAAGGKRRKRFLFF
jgi:protein-tyrosine phosphatase